MGSVWGLTCVQLLFLKFSPKASADLLISSNPTPKYTWKKVYGASSRIYLFNLLISHFEKWVNRRQPSFSRSLNVLKFFPHIGRKFLKQIPNNYVVLKWKLDNPVKFNTFLKNTLIDLAIYSSEEFSTYLVSFWINFSILKIYELL